MNIIIYYLSKKIILQTKTQHTDNQNITSIDLLKKTHNEHTHLVNEKEIKRNTIGKSFRYVYTTYYNGTLYKSYYGDIQDYKIKTNLIDIY